MRSSNLVYGPVPSRRLGRSLGIDVVPFKHCTYDCIYCQLGQTTHKITKRQNFIRVDEILVQLKERLNSNPDFITIAGSGEPCLCTGLDQFINGIKTITKIPVAVITNGSLLHDPDVRSEISNADVVIPSLDAGSERIFKYINRPHRNVSYDSMLDGLIRFREMYEGQYWLEVFLLAGINTTSKEIAGIKEAISKIKPDKVQLNTAVRPPCESYAEAVPLEQLTIIAEQFGNNAEIIAQFPGTEQYINEVDSDTIIATLKRRPCTLADLSNGLKCSPNHILKLTESLIKQGKIEVKSGQNKLYYKAVVR